MCSLVFYSVYHTILFSYSSLKKNFRDIISYRKFSHIKIRAGATLICDLRNDGMHKNQILLCYAIYYFGLNNVCVYLYFT